MDNKIYTKIYLWMFVGLFVSFLTGYYVSTQSNMIYNIMSAKYTIFILIAEIAIAVFLSTRIKKMKGITAKILFFVYSFLTGLTLSLIFVAYELNSIIFIFAITSGLFGLFALLGYFINIDLSKLGTILFMTLLGIIIGYVVNVFIGSTTFDTVLCIIGIILFMLYIAYDIQRVKVLQNIITDEDNLAIFCAFQLYLDFINLFYRLISLFGKYKD